MPLPKRPSSANQLASGSNAEPRRLAWPSPPVAEVIPNFETWALGDILVMESRSSRNWVQFYQSKHGSSDIRQSASWTHCAIYVGDGLIVDTMPKDGARIRRLFPETDRAIAVRRIDPALTTADEGLRIAEIATSTERIPYTSFLKLGLGNGATTLAPNGFPQSLYCSSLVYWVADRAGVPLTLAPNFDAEMLPAGLLFNSYLVDVPSFWRPPA